MADLETTCASCAANIVVAEVVADASESKSFLCAKCQAAGIVL